MSDVSSKDCYPFSWPVRVYYEDTDTGGVVYYANYLKFYERARTEALRSVGFSQEQLKQQYRLIFVVSQLDADFKGPAFLDDELVVTARIVRFARSYLLFEQEILKVVKGEALLINRATIKIACVHSETYRPRGLPSELSDTLVLLADT